MWRKVKRWCSAGWRVAGVIALLTMAAPGLAQSDDSVSTVGPDTITRADFHARVRLVRWEYVQQLDKLYELTGGNLGLTPDTVERLASSLDDAKALGDAVLGQLEDERLLWQAGEQLGITPTAEEADAQETAFFSLWTGVAVAELPTNADAQAFITQWYAGAEAASGLSRYDVQILFATEALRQKLYAHVLASVPTEEPAAHTRHILCSFHPDAVTDLTPPTAEQRAAAEACIAAARSRLDAGESFASVAGDLSDDRASAQQGGDMDWVLLSYLPTAYADAVRDVAPGTLVGPVETEFGLHLIELIERRAQTLTADELAASQQGYFQLWLDTLRARAAPQRSPDWDADLPTEPDLAALAPATLSAVDALRSGQ